MFQDGTMPMSSSLWLDSPISLTNHRYQEAQNDLMEQLVGADKLSRP